MNKRKTIIGAITLYVVTTVLSYGAFSYFDNPSFFDSPLPLNADGSVNLDPDAPKTEACPLNGQLYTRAERYLWEQRRPLAIMLENSVDARPHSGLVRADVVYETVAEGGVTRFMPVFYCDAQASDVTVAPVRSVRTYFIDWASEYGKTPLFAHVGGANCSAPKLEDGTFGPCTTDKRAQALEQLTEYGWRHKTGNDLDQFSVGAPTYIRNLERTGKTVATEHSVVSSTKKLWDVGENRGWTNKSPNGREWMDDFRTWRFKDEAKADSRGNVTSISHDFWKGYKQYDARWEYDREENVYKRLTGGEPHMDLESKTQVTAKNVVIQFTKETTNIDPLKHLLYQTIGEGRALIFQDGQVIDGFWSKDSRTGRTIFENKKGEEIEFVRGRIWISIVDNIVNVAY